MNNKPTVAISTDFLTAYAALPRQKQGKVTEFFNKFRNDPMHPGINFEKINEGIDKNICSVRIDDTYRGIVVREPESNVYILLWVDHHDEAYAWAKRKKCSINKRTQTYYGSGGTETITGVLITIKKEAVTGTTIADITLAVCALFDLPAHKVAVLVKN